MKRKSNDLRILVERALNKNMSYRTISELYGVGLRTITKWKKELANGSFYEQKQRAPKIHPATDAILNFIREKPLSSVYQIKCHLAHNNINISRSTVFRILKNNRLSYKKCHSKVQSPKATPEKIQEKKEQLKNVEKPIYALDETAICLVNYPYNGWAEIGQKLFYLQEKAFGVRTITMIMTISDVKIESYQLFTKAIDRYKMIEYLSSFPVLDGYLFMDNLRVHHNQLVKDTLTTKNLDPLYNLPYCPDLNPIENVFGIIKSHIRRDMIVGLDAIKEYLPTLIQHLNETLDFKAIFRHAFE
jgi:transposase